MEVRSSQEEAARSSSGLRWALPLPEEPGRNPGWDVEPRQKMASPSSSSSSGAGQLLLKLQSFLLTCFQTFLRGFVQSHDRRWTDLLHAKLLPEHWLNWLTASKEDGNSGQRVTRPVWTGTADQLRPTQTSSDQFSTHLPGCGSRLQVFLAPTFL